MKLAFYKAFQSRRTGESRYSYLKRLWLDWVIATASLGRYSHVELVDGEDWFSISPRTGTVQFRKIIPKETSWDFVPLNLTEDDIILVRKEFERYDGYKYDYLGAIFSITVFCVNFKDKVFCSEVCANILRKTKKYKELPKGCVLSPTDLNRRIKDYQIWKRQR